MRLPRFLLYPFPIIITVGVPLMAIKGFITPMIAFETWMILFIGWMAWSTASGLYPWSMRP